MRTRGKLWRTAAAAAALAMVATACGGDDEPEPADTETEAPADTESPTDGETAAGSIEDIEFDTGVTAEPCPEAVNEDNGCIFVGLITDASGPFQTFGGPITEGQQAFWQRVNEEGGIGGLFDVAVPENLVADGQYSPQATAEAYQRLEPEIAILGQTLGTPQTQAIIPNMERDDVLSATLTWWSGWAFEQGDQGQVLESGSNYCGDTMNGLDYLVEQGGDISSVLHVGFPGDYGGDARAGLNAAAEANDIEVVAEVDQTPIAAGGEVTDAVSTILREQPDVVFLTVGPQEAGQIIGGTLQQGYQGRFVGNHPVFLPQLAQEDAIVQALTVIGPHDSYNGDAPGLEAFRQTYEEMFGGVPANDGATFGWVAEYPIKAVLEQAVSNGDLTRAGIVAAVEGVEVDYEGIVPNKTYAGDASEIIQRETTISQPDPEAPTGISSIETAYTGPTIQDFAFDEPCVTLG